MSKFSDEQMTVFLHGMIDELNNSPEAMYLVVNKDAFVKEFQESIDEIRQDYEGQFADMNECLEEMKISIGEHFARELDFNPRTFPEGTVVPNPNYSGE